MTKEQLIESKEIKNKIQVLNKLEKNLYLSFSSLKETLDFLEELEQIKDIKALNFLEEMTIEYGDSKKENTKKFLEYIRETRSPLMYKALKELKKNLNSFKGTNLKAVYPENLEGDNIKIIAEIKNESDIDKLIKNLENNKEKLKKAINIVKKGG